MDRRPRSIGRGVEVLHEAILSRGLVLIFRDSLKASKGKGRRGH